MGASPPNTIIVEGRPARWLRRHRRGGQAAPDGLTLGLGTRLATGDERRALPPPPFDVEGPARGRLISRPMLLASRASGARTWADRPGREPAGQITCGSGGWLPSAIIGRAFARAAGIGSATSLQRQRRRRPAGLAGGHVDWCSTASSAPGPAGPAGRACASWPMAKARSWPDPTQVPTFAELGLHLRRLHLELPAPAATPMPTSRASARRSARRWHSLPSSSAPGPGQLGPAWAPPLPAKTRRL